MASEACWSCHGAAPSWACMCEECGGSGQLILCPDRARHSSSTVGPRMDGRNYWDASDGQCSNPFHCKSGGQPGLASDEAAAYAPSRHLG